MVKFRPSSGYRNSRPFVSQGSGRVDLSRTTRLGSQAASGGSPRPVRKEAGRMRRTVPRRTWARGALVATMALTLAQMGAGPPKKKKEGLPPKVQETVGDLSFVVSRGETKVEGVGLVVGLDNTGVDAPSSWYRKQLVDEMSKAGVEKSEKFLTNPQVSMVIVRLTIPVGVNSTDRLDVQVEVPPACGTTSLAGGYLMMTRLREVLLAG